MVYSCFTFSLFYTEKVVDVRMQHLTTVDLLDKDLSKAIVKMVKPPEKRMYHVNQFEIRQYYAQPHFSFHHFSDYCSHV